MVDEEQKFCSSVPAGAEQEQHRTGSSRDTFAQKGKNQLTLGFHWEENEQKGLKF